MFNSPIMPTYAVLGATGQTGSEIIKHLLPTSAKLHVYARNKSRLEKAHPTLSSSPNVTTFIGDLSDTKLLASCLEGVDVILSTVAQNQNEPGCSIAQQTALAIIKALESSQTRKEGKCPTVVFLASRTIDPDVEDNKGWGGWIVHNIFYHIYTDLEEAIVLLQSYPWIPLVIAAPGALLHGESTTVELQDTANTASPLLSYADLAQGMIMMGQDERWQGKYVGMYVNGGKSIGGNPLALFRYIIPGMIGTLCPPLWRLGKGWWPA